MNYYNDSDPKVCAWARELIRAELVPAGEVDCRSIADVRAADLRGFTQCHFFSGILGWPYALRLAGVPDDLPLWTGSCPCQPFSDVGQGKEEEDERHLWPALRGLVAECRPPICFGEQVASKAGRWWLAGVRADLEELGYAVGAADLCAAGVGAPHIRQRLFWVADAHGWGLDSRRRGQHQEPQPQGRPWLAKQPSRFGVVPGLGHATSEGLEGQWREHRASGEGGGGLVGLAMQIGGQGWNGPTVALRCSDGPRRASAEPSAFPMAHGISARVGRLRGYGNAIVPQVAAEFIQAFLDITHPHTGENAL